MNIKLIDAKCEHDLNMTPKYRETILNAKAQFFSGIKFKVYARLFAQIIF